VLRVDGCSHVRTLHGSRPVVRVSHGMEGIDGDVVGYGCP
jgi:hypothetical protein